MRYSPCRSLVLAAALWSGGLLAQTPENPPPWWRVQDNVTVSLYWNFNAPFANGTFPPPTLVVAPPWYNPAVTQGVATTNLGYVASLGGFSGVFGVTNAGGTVSADLDLTVDNDPYPDWIKLFWFQYDEFEGATGSIRAVIEQSLSYKRAIISEKSVALGGGWNRVTIEAQLIPQPDDEGIDFSFLLSAAGTIGIDNLYVNSKCVKPPPDESGDAFGDVEARVDLDGVTAGADCRAIAIVEGPAPTFAREYWLVAAAATQGAAHRLLRLAGSPPTSVASNLPLAATTITAPQGPGDIAVERLPVPGGQGVIVWVILDNRTANGGVALQGVHTVSGAVVNLPLVGFPLAAVVPINQMLGLAFEPSGEQGLGTFWVSATDAGGQGRLFEFSRATATPGALLTSAPMESDCGGLGYDDTLGRFYAFRSTPQATPTQPIQAHGYEISAYDLQPTGTRFCSDLTVPNGAGPRGGLARGLEVWRSRSQPRSHLKLAGVVATVGNPASSRSIVELAGPFAFGWSRLGRCGMANIGPYRGLPFVGAQLTVELRGVPDSAFAMLYVGFSNVVSPAGPLPIDLGPLLGWQESVLSVSPDVSSSLLLPSAPGTFQLTFNIPNNPQLAYQSVFCQWLALDIGVPGYFAMSQAGKTVVYP
ncbi:MAG: hypothetical protein FJ301_10145 [Planctomycetes bacterium]|nr:hypothetical protein [Planctomycetota bacterium]